MKPTSKKAIMAILVTLTVSSTMLVQTVYGATPEPSVPEFTVKYVDHVDSKTIELTIKNPLYTGIGDLYYSVRVKENSTPIWTTLYRREDNYGPKGPKMSDSEYTTITFRNSSDNRFSGPEGATIIVPASGKIDIQIAVFEDSVETYGQGISWGYRDVWERVGSWSPKQTITIPRTPTPTIKPTPSPTPPDLIEVLSSFGWEKITLVVLTVVVAIMAVGMAVLWRRIPAKRFSDREGGN